MCRFDRRDTIFSQNRGVKLSASVVTLRLLSESSGGYFFLHYPTTFHHMSCSCPRGQQRTGDFSWVAKVDGRRKPKALTPSSQTRPSYGIGMPSARDCPMGVLLSRHHGIGSHVKFAVRTETSERSSGRRGERTGMMTYKGRND
ncbi:hypothetical protein EVAR_27276_1 [Eumeta japonica]|uniref:Uncharacterized protein n=1 Tax=Eumeta variegata TaxID=151549 RepID=A0A4C1VZ52_EUMVA|nr:hypothetical protein EVAR_27276_1 [Eumeta japonica]